MSKYASMAFYQISSYQHKLYQKSFSYYYIQKLNNYQSLTAYGVDAYSISSFCDKQIRVFNSLRPGHYTIAGQLPAEASTKFLTS